jgi:hypothetical protein
MRASRSVQTFLAVWGKVPDEEAQTGAINNRLPKPRRILTRRLR